PIYPRATSRKDCLELALHGGEDYELLFTAPAAVHVPSRIEGITVTRIGEITHRRRGKPEIELLTYGKRTPLVPRGWEHFRAKRSTIILRNRFDASNNTPAPIPKSTTALLQRCTMPAPRRITPRAMSIM